MNIGIDLDDTICLTHEKMLEEALLFDKQKVKGQGFKDKNGQTFMDMFYWNVMDVTNFLDYIKKSDFYAKLEPKPLASEYINKLYKKGHKIIFITRRTNNLKNRMLTKKWLKKNGFNFNKVILGCENKADVCLREKINLFIDNDEKNVLMVKNVGVKVLLMDSPSTKTVSGVRKVKNFRQVYNFAIKMVIK